MESELIQIIAAELALFPPVADRVAVEVAELHHDVDRAAAKPDERLDDLHPLLCTAHPYAPLAPSFGPGFPPQSHIPVLRSTNTLTL